MRKILFSFLSVYLTRDFDFRFFIMIQFSSGPLWGILRKFAEIHICNCVFIACVKGPGELIRAKKLEAEISCQTPFKGTLLSYEKDGVLELGKLWILYWILYMLCCCTRGLFIIWYMISTIWKWMGRINKT
jgi:hypothetical protein